MFTTKIAIPDYPANLPELIRLEAEADPHGPVPAAVLVFETETSGWFQMGGESFEVRSTEIRSLIGDVVLVNRERGVGERLVRRRSEHNTLLITERCDQLCVMCSQPPKEYELNLFAHYREALAHAAPGAIIGISGGEPLLYKSELLKLIADTRQRRPDIAFHVLTNGQHLEEADIPLLASLLHDRLRFAVPLYADAPELHDKIVAKPGAFLRALEGIRVLMEAGVEVEIRTVLMRPNAASLPDIARFIAWTIPDIAHWAIMQMEYIGFARKNWETLFFDHSLDELPLRAALTITRQHGIETLFYNMPLCTLHTDLRSYAPPTISDWKRKFLDLCDGCKVRSDCAGFFAWQSRDKTFQNLGPLPGLDMDIRCVSS
ncbi:His-Xaa-Ser system radical SAM maturase HxsC [Thioclava sp. GXIMD4215]|uniref:His-Xaa-Ser system radical SAM maturase HxsC n=1 Tax=Thioclava sp. GXIMD4215 TaxID=3131928 RepID=UPI00311B2800